MEENNQLVPIPQNKLIPKVSTSLNITNKLIFENNRKLVLEIFERNPKLFVDLISRYYPLTDYIIKEFFSFDLFVAKFSKITDFNSDHNSSSFNIEVIAGKELPVNNIINEASFKSNNLSENKLYVCSYVFHSSGTHRVQVISSLTDEEFKIVKRLADIDKMINWKLISSNPNVTWNTDLIEKFSGRWDWGNLSQNEFLPWSIELIEKFKDKWDWYNLSSNEFLPWSIELIDKYENKWDWYNLSENRSINDSIFYKYLLKYIDQIDKNALFYENSYFDVIYNNSENIETPETIKEREQDSFSLRDCHKKAGELVSNKNLWEKLKPFVDNGLINEIFEKLKKNE